MAAKAWSRVGVGVCGCVGACGVGWQSSCLLDMDPFSMENATAASRRAARARAVSFLSDGSDDESLPALSDEEVDPAELKRIAQEEARLMRNDPAELAAHAEQAAQRVTIMEDTRAQREADPVPLEERLEAKHAAGRSRWEADTADMQEKLDADFRDLKQHVASGKATSMERMEARQKERDAEREARMAAHQARVASMTASLSAEVDAELGLADDATRRDAHERERASYQKQLDDAAAKLDAATRPAPMRDIAATRRAPIAETLASRRNPYEQALGKSRAGNGGSLADKLAALETKLR